MVSLFPKEDRESSNLRPLRPVGQICAMALATVFITFLLAGFIKGVVGLGLPTIAMGLLAIFMPPAQAAALLILPSLATNLWQALVGPGLLPLLRRLWPMLLGVCLGTWAGAGLMLAVPPPLAGGALGMALILYALAGLARFELHLGRADRFLAPVIGAATGLVTAVTGVFVIPAVPYLQGLGLGKEALVQALGLSFTVSTLALAGNLLGSGLLTSELALPSLLGLVAALAGMAVGQAVRLRLSQERFRLLFFASLLCFGAYLALRTLV
jgi:uncharacterized membrane protein YfcA